MARVGLVVNPHAAGDVRRLTSLAPNLQLAQRVNLTARVLSGVAAAGALDVLAMPEPFGIVDRAADLLARSDADGIGTALRVTETDTPLATDSDGTRAAAAAMRAAGVACVVTVGGDGTVRAVVTGWPDAIAVPVAGGTNNSVAVPVGPEAVGLAAGRFALDPRTHARFVERHTVLESDDSHGDRRLAVADVTLTSHGWTGSHAVWDPARLLETVIARSDGTRTGLAGLAGRVSELGPGEALHLRFGAPGRRLLAPLAPGRFVPVEIRDWRVLAPGEAIALTLPAASATVAFDGERELVVHQPQRIRVRPRSGRLAVLSVAALLHAATDGR